MARLLLLLSLGAALALFVVLTHSGSALASSGAPPSPQGCHVVGGPALVGVWWAGLSLLVPSALRRRRRPPPPEPRKAEPAHRLH